MRWTHLRPIQVDAIHAISDGDRPVIISAKTASGKTEAAFLPVISQLVEDYGGSIRALYIGPLKALINDQFRRLEVLCERAAIPVHRWHGDVGQSAKRNLLRHPSGILLITPESIESLHVNHAHHLPSLFGRLAFVVIDELHAFMGTERGAHLKSLLTRLGRKSDQSVCIIALSATLGDLHAAGAWLCPEDPDRVCLITDSREEKTIRLILKGYLRDTGKSTAVLDASSTVDRNVPEQPVETPGDTLLAADVFSAFHGTTALIFANSRAKLEFYADLVGRKAEHEGVPNLFRVHHGSLSKAERENTEAALRSEIPTAAFCSSTLELGIDVGNVTAVGQIGAPWSVSSLAQRLGRSGRRDGEASVLRMYIEEDHPANQTRLIDRLYPDLLQAVATTELMLGKWCEPPEIERMHLSTLVQQILSTITEYGGARADLLRELLVTRGAFHAIDHYTFIQVLRSMGASDLIEQAPEGELILGLRGEQIVRSFDFYSAFPSSEELRVVHRGHMIGTVLAAPGIGGDGYIILAGRRWKVLEVDMSRREMVVEPSRGGRLPLFAVKPGVDIHQTVRQKMREILHDRLVPRYLDATAQEMLEQARNAASDAEILSAPLFTEGQDCIWFTWTGTRINRTLMAIGKYHLGLPVNDDGIALSFERTSERDVRAAYRATLSSGITAEELAALFPVKTVDKYDWCLSHDLQSHVFARNHLDLEGARIVIEQTC